MARNRYENRDRDYRAELTNQIIELVEKGVAPWQKPWSPGQAASALELPYNVASGRPYHGGNVMWLMARSAIEGFDDPRWCTFKQASEKGWHVKRGSKATTVEYWQFEKQDKGRNPDTGQVEMRTVKTPPRVFYAKVFNAKQVEGIPAYEPREKESWDPVEAGERALTNSGAKILHDQLDRAFYSPLRDSIHLPPRSSFKTGPDYYEIALHELGHWSGHSSRMARDLSGSFGSEAYAREELRAQMASLFLSVEVGIPFNPGRHASYQASWVNALKEDKNEIFRAARDAEDIAEYVIGLAREREKDVGHGQESPEWSSVMSKEQWAGSIRQSVRENEHYLSSATDPEYRGELEGLLARQREHLNELQSRSGERIVAGSPSKDMRTFDQSLADRMERADWYYAYSDDANVYKRSVEEQRTLYSDLENLAKTDPLKAGELWGKYAPADIPRPSFLLSECDNELQGRGEATEDPGAPSGLHYEVRGFDGKGDVEIVLGRHDTPENAYKSFMDEMKSGSVRIVDGDLEITLADTNHEFGNPNARYPVFYDPALSRVHREVEQAERTATRQRELATAFRRDNEVLKDHPELVLAFGALAAGRKFAEREWPNSKQEQERFVSATREYLAGKIERGEQVPTPKIRTREQGIGQPEKRDSEQEFER